MRNLFDWHMERMEFKKMGKLIGTVVAACLIVLLATGSGVLSEETESLTLCVIQTSCKSCLEASSKCAWCSDWVSRYRDTYLIEKRTPTS